MGQAIEDDAKSCDIEIQRIYETLSGHGGYRVLVDRLWPRGVKKVDARVDEWPKDVAPSDELRRTVARHRGSRSSSSPSARAA